MALRPEVRGQHTLRSATMSDVMTEHALGVCSRCGHATEPYNPCQECSGLSMAMGSGMQDVPLAAPQF